MGIADKTTTDPEKQDSTLRRSSSEEVDVEDVDELSKSILFAQARCLYKHIINYFIMSSMSGERSSRRVSVPVILRSGPAAAEARRRFRSRGSRHFQDLALSQGSEACAAVFPL